MVVFTTLFISLFLGAQMSHSSNGPVSSMPGSVFNPVRGTKCDEHPEVDAVKRVQGETDSFGAEYTFMCRHCLDKFNEYRSKPVEGYCDWCKNFFVGLLNRRDYDEGMCGPVYRVCVPCIAASNKAFEEEYAHYESTAEFNSDYDLL
jgi:hypothetical protein